VADSNFVDYAKIYCRSGRGGNGSAHLARYKYVPKGGPDGGDGGKGGDIIVRGNKNLWTLIHLKYNRHHFAEHGQAGGSNNKTGAQGENKIIEVPLGTIIKDENGNIIYEITEHGQEVILLKGGRGGRGNTHFKSATNQTPRYAEPGGEEKEGWFIFELKVLADVGLVGFPNAGKSTLLSVLSAAKPKIADYPFTTLEPQLGIVRVSETESFIMADIPGIIEKASEGKGIGLRFLRHIERNSVLLFTIPVDSLNIEKQYKILLNELKKYNPLLLHKQRVIAITKTDLADKEIIQEVEKTIPNNIPYTFVSSFTKHGIEQLKHLLWQVLNQNYD